jgi:sulfotransferase family protein
MADGTSIKKPIFLVGLHRTGSTLWHNVIALSPSIMRLTEMRFLSQRRQRDFRYFLKTQIGDLSVDENVDKMVRLCLSRKGPPGLDGAFWRFENIEAVEKSELATNISRRIKKSNRSLGEIFRAFIDEITQCSGFSRACVKFPVDVGHIAELVEWYPECKIVHMTRDPRAIALSKTNDPSGTALRVRQHPRLAWLIRKVMILFEIVQYRWTARQHVRVRHLRNYKVFRYEDLLAEPERTVKELCEFLEVDFTEDMLRPEKGRHEHQPSSLTGKRRQAFDPVAALRWQTVISRADNWLVSFFSKKSMKALGYDPATHRIFEIARVGLKQQDSRGNVLVEHSTGH